MGEAPVVQAKYRQLDPPGTGVLVVWKLETGQVGDWQAWPQFRKRTISIFAGQILLEGTNDEADDDDVHALHDDAQGLEIAVPGIYVIRETPLRLRPRAEAGPVIVRMFATP